MKINDDNVEQVREALTQYYAAKYVDVQKEYNSPDAVCNYLVSWIGGNITESVVCLYFDVKLKLLKAEKVFVGGFSSCQIEPLPIIRQAALVGSETIIMAHNHPSGNLSPSKNDIKMTKMVCVASFYSNIKLCDHIIIGPEWNKYFSFKNAGLLSSLEKKLKSMEEV